MLSISAHNALSARTEALTQQLAQAALAHHPVVSPIEDLERWLSRRSEVLHLQLTLLDEDAGNQVQDQASDTLAQRYVEQLDALAGAFAARHREAIEARMPPGKTIHVVAEDGSGFVALDAEEVARRMARFNRRLETEMEVHRGFSFGPAQQRAALRHDLEQEWTAIEATLCELKEQRDALNLPAVELQSGLGYALARLRGERHATVIDAGLHQGWLFACQEGRLEVAGLVVRNVPEAERRAFIDRPGADGCNAFHVACEQQDLVLAAWLVQLGANAHQRTEPGRLPMQLATHYDRGERTRTMLAWLTLLGADPLACDENGRSALNEAAYHGNGSAVCWLLEQGASLAERDRQQRTPLHAAAAAGHADMVSLLLARGADPHARNGAGERPVFEACRMGRIAAMQAFLDAGLWLDRQEREHLRRSGMVSAQAVAAACSAPLKAALTQAAVPVPKPAMETVTQAFLQAPGQAAPAATQAATQAAAGRTRRGKTGETATAAAATVGEATHGKPLLSLPKALQRLRRW